MQSPSVSLPAATASILVHPDAGLVRGASLIERLPDRAPEDVDPRMRDLFDDVRGTLQTPMINSIFRTLANQPDWLESAWDWIRASAGSGEFEAAARRLAEEAEAHTAEEREIDGPPLLAIEAEARAFTEANAYVLPKSLLIATAFARLADGSAARRARPVRRARFHERGRYDLPRRPRTDDLPLRGIALPLVDPSHASGRLAAALGDVRQTHAHPRVPSFYRGIATWPTLLVRLWATVRPVVGTERYRAWRDALVVQAERSWEELEAASVRRPALRPLPGASSEDVHAICEYFRRRMIPEVLLDVVMIERLLSAGMPVQWEATAH